MTKTMAYVGAPGPSQSELNIFPTQNSGSDLGYILAEANQQIDMPSGGEGNVSHPTMLTHAERGRKSSSYQIVLEFYSVQHVSSKNRKSSDAIYCRLEGDF